MFFDDNFLFLCFVFFSEFLDDDDEVLLALAQELGGLLPQVGGAAWVSSLLNVLQELALLEESTVRDAVSICDFSLSLLGFGARLHKMREGQPFLCLYFFSRLDVSCLSSLFSRSFFLMFSLSAVVTPQNIYLPHMSLLLVFCSSFAAFALLVLQAVASITSLSVPSLRSRCWTLLFLSSRQAE